MPVSSKCHFGRNLLKIKQKSSFGLHLYVELDFEQRASSNDAKPQKAVVCQAGAGRVQGWGL